MVVGGGGGRVTEKRHTCTLKQAYIRDLGRERRRIFFYQNIKVEKLGKLGERDELLGR